MSLQINKLSIAGLDAEANSTVCRRLHDILVAWEGTPYMPGNRIRGAGVDCVGFVASVLNELYGIHIYMDRLPQDVAFHSKEKSYAAFRSFLDRYPHRETAAEEAQPGDIVVAGPLNGGPGHGLVVGLNCLWHCDSKSVVRTGTVFTTGGVYFLKKVFRPLNRERWLP